MTDWEQLRRDHYNATATLGRRVHDELLILRVRHDAGPLAFIPGQYTALGLGDWEPRIRADHEEIRDADRPPRVIQRAYSIGAAMIDDAGQLLPPERQPDNEFYVALPRFTDRHPPALTPRLFTLCEGARLYVDPRVHGHYTTELVRPDDTVVLVATGTGEAPHNAMVAHLLAAGHRGPIIAVTCVRYRSDLAYLTAHDALQRSFVNYRYIPLTTREPENLDPSRGGYVGKRYLQDYFASGDFERDTGVALRPDRLHVFLCGNPAMIGVPRRADDPAGRYPQPTGMVEILERRGLAADRPHAPGSIHFESYW